MQPYGATSCAFLTFMHMLRQQPSSPPPGPGCMCTRMPKYTRIHPHRPHHKALHWPTPKQNSTSTAQQHTKQMERKSRDLEPVRFTQLYYFISSSTHASSTFRGTTKLSGSMEFDVSLSSRAVSHFITLRPRLGTMAIPLAAVVERNSLMAKHHGFSSTH